METIRIDRSDLVARVWLTRADVHNALTAQAIGELAEAFRTLGNEPGVRVIVLGGEGKSFCAGADVEYMRSVATYGEAENVEDAKRLAGLFASIQECPKPVIARVQGAALGGGAGLVAAADVVVAAEDASLGFTEAVLGIMPAVISPFVLAKIGPGAARELFLTGERITSARALQIGLIQHVAPAADLDKLVSERVEKLLAAAPGAQAAIKALLWKVTYRTPSDVLDLTARAIAERRASDEGQEGLKAFLEKRVPNWRRG
jgi:methylglutaconyl-CoA hydratase